MGKWEVLAGGTTLLELIVPSSTNNGSSCWLLLAGGPTLLEVIIVPTSNGLQAWFQQAPAVGAPGPKQSLVERRMGLFFGVAPVYLRSCAYLKP